MSTIRLRYATSGLRGLTSNRRLSIGSSGWLPLGVIADVWKGVIRATLKLNRSILGILQQ